MHYIGMDTSIASLDFAVVNERGKIKKRTKINTSEKGLIEFMRLIPKPRILFAEEGSLASWVAEVCYRHGEKVIIMDPKQNHWISRDEDKNDSIDALKIAELARGNFYKEISHAVGHRKRFRELMLYYHDTVRMQTRLKNVIKAKFRQYGVNCQGQTIFIEKYQKEWFLKLQKEPQSQWMIKLLLDQYKSVREQIESIKAKIKSQAKTYSEIKLFREMPGIDWINAATFSALIENPFRFATRKKLWRYAGIGIAKKSSSTIIYKEQSNRNYNRLLKYTLKQAVRVTLASKNNPFRQKYIALILKGVDSKKAFLKICRSFLTTLWTMWERGEHYRFENA